MQRCRDRQQDLVDSIFQLTYRVLTKGLSLRLALPERSVHLLLARLLLLQAPLLTVWVQCWRSELLRCVLLRCVDAGQAGRSGHPGLQHGGPSGSLRQGYPDSNKVLI